MKNQRRHELETNALADRIGMGLERAQPVMPLVVGGLAIAVIGALVWALYTSRVNRQAAVAWTDYYLQLEGSDAEAFRDVAASFPNTPAAGWAHLTAGNTMLEQGIELLYRDRAAGEEMLQSAIAEFEAAASRGRPPQLMTKANFGLAQAFESLGQLDEAAQYYEQTIASLAHPGLVSEAQNRLAFVSSQRGNNFYSWFNQLEPQPDAPFELPDDLSMPPTSPDMQFDSPGGAFQSPGGGFQSPGGTFQGSAPGIAPGAAGAGGAAADGADTSSPLDPDSLPTFPGGDQPSGPVTEQPTSGLQLGDPPLPGDAGGSTPDDGATADDAASSPPADGLQLDLPSEDQQP